MTGKKPAQAEDEPFAGLHEYLAGFEEILKGLERPEGPKVQAEDLEPWLLPKSLIFRSKREATAASKALNKSIGFLTALASLYRELPAAVDERMNLHSDVIIPEAYSEDEPNLLPRRESHRSYSDLVAALKSEAEAELRRVDDEINLWWAEGKPGRGANWGARHIAVDVARLNT